MTFISVLQFPCTRVFTVRSKREGILNPSFDYQTVYNKFKKSSASVRLTDVVDLVARLAVCKEKTGLEYFTEEDGQGQLIRIFVEQAGAREVWGTDRKRCFIENVLQFDPTWGTNCYGMKLSMFVTVDGRGASTILAYMVHHEEDFEDVYWGFRCFHRVFKSAPTTLMTDSGSGILQATAQMKMDMYPWCDTAHLLCVYHIDQNFFENVHCLFANRPAEWQTIHNKFWRVAKDYDEELRETLDDRLADMREYIKDNGKGSA